MPEEQNKHIHHRARLRREAQPGVELLSSEKLLELLLFEALTRCDTADIAKKLLKNDGGVTGLFLSPRPAETPEEEAPEAGVVRQYLQVLGALCRRYRDQSDPYYVGFRSLAAARRWFISVMLTAEQKEIGILALREDLAFGQITRLPYTEETEVFELQQAVQKAVTQRCLYAFLAIHHQEGLLAPSYEEMNALVSFVELCRLHGALPADVILLSADGVRALSETQHFPKGTFLDFTEKG